MVHSRLLESHQLTPSHLDFQVPDDDVDGLHTGHLCNLQNSTRVELLSPYSFTELSSFFDLQCEEGVLVFLKCRDIPKRAYFGSDEKGDRKAQCDCSRNTPPFTLCLGRKLVDWCLRTGRVKANCDGREIWLRGKMAGSAVNALEQGMHAFVSFTDASLSAVQVLLE